MKPKHLKSECRVPQSEEEVCSSLICRHKLWRDDYGRKSAIRTGVVWLPFHTWSKDAVGEASHLLVESGPLLKYTCWNTRAVLAPVAVARYSDTGQLPKTQWRFLAPQIYLSAEAGFLWVVHAVSSKIRSHRKWSLGSPVAGCSWGRSHGIHDSGRLNTFVAGRLCQCNLGWPRFEDQKPPKMTRGKSCESELYSWNFT